MIGGTLAHYQILEKLGAGGMGAVYRAADTKLGRDVALKLLRPEDLPDAAARARLAQEARTASALNHPHICTIYEIGEAEGQTYVAMELVAGKPLAALIPPEGLPTELVVRYGTQIADALAHAHDRSVVHRDLKPANVVITPEGRAKVLDFGLAKRFRAEELAEATRSELSLSEPGAVAGTLHYLAPEILRGNPADLRSDIWALGVTLYEMAAGALPFQGRTGFEVSSGIMRETPPSMPTAVPTGLRAVILRCLAKEPGQRHQRAGEVRAALEALQSDSALAGSPPVEAKAGRRWLWPVAVGLILIAGGIIAAVIRGVPFSIGFTRIVERSATTGPRLSTGARPSANPEANEYFEKAVLFMGMGHYDLTRARQMFERALELDPRFAAARAEYGFTHLLMLESGYSSDTSWLYKAEEELRQALRDDPNSARVHSALAAVYLYQSRKELVPGEVEKALKASPEDIDALIWLSNYHQLNGDYAAAQALNRQMMERNPVYWPARMNSGEILRQQGDIAGAIRAQEKGLEQDPLNVYAIGFLARAYLDAGNLPQARRSLERVRGADRQNYRTRAAWCLLLALEGKRAEARKEMDDELLKYAAANVWVTSSAAEFYALLGETSKALEWLERAVRLGDERVEWFRRDPLLANIREHPRFKQILDSIAYRRQQRGSAKAEPRN